MMTFRLEKPDESGSKGESNNLEIVSKGRKSITPDEDDDIPPNFEGLAEGNQATNTAEKEPKTLVSTGKSDSVQNDDIPPNWEGLVDGIGAHDVVSEGATAEEVPKEIVAQTRRTGDDEIPTEISVENSLAKVKKLADVVSTAEDVPLQSVEKLKRAQKDEEGDKEDAPVAVGKTVTTYLNEEGDDGSEDLGTEEVMGKDRIPNLESKTSAGQKSSERGMNA